MPVSRTRKSARKSGRSPQPLREGAVLLERAGAGRCGTAQLLRLREILLSTYAPMLARTEPSAEDEQLRAVVRLAGDREAFLRRFRAVGA